MKMGQLLAILNVYRVTPAEFFGDGVQRKVLAELERLSPAEMKIVTGLRSLSEIQRQRVVDRFLVMLEASRRELHG
jgi:hypothetical protein